VSWNNAEYFRMRAETERALAATANNSIVAGVHLELAKRYEELVLKGNRPTLGVVFSGQRKSGSDSH
jgi:hypothetical protein